MENFQPRRLLPQWIKPLWWQVVLSGAYFCLMYFYHPFRILFRMDYDEGINIVKAQMLLKGYALYTDIWSDQPPLFTFLLASSLQAFGLRVNVARVLVLFLASGLLFFYINYMVNVYSKWHVLPGVILLLLLPRFVNLSVSVKIGLPSIAFAMVSLATLVNWHKGRSYLWLFLSAVSLGASVLVKIFTGFLAPVFLVGIITGEYARYRDFSKWRQVLAPGILWGGVFALMVCIPLLLFVHPENIGQLLDAHLQGTQLDIFRDDPTVTLAYHLIEARPVLLLSLLGAIQAVISKRWVALYPAVWMGMAAVLLYFHSPVWGHQQLLVTIPAVMLASGAAGDAFKRVLSFVKDKSPIVKWDLVGLVALVVWIFIVLTRIPVTLSAFKATPTFQKTSQWVTVLDAIQQYSPDTHWFVTDIPIYAFYADLPVPPNLAVFTSKRVETGNLTEAEVLATIHTYQPEQVLFGRNEFPLVQRYLEENYQLVFDREPLFLYLKKGIKP